MSFFAKVEIATGKILGHGILQPENASRMPCSEGQMMIEVPENIDPHLHSFVDLETHQLLDKDRNPIDSHELFRKTPEVVEEPNSPVKMLPVEQK